MTATNHYLFGVGLAVVLKNPLLVLPLAFVSHFVLDILPHFGLKFSEARGKTVLRVTAVDSIFLIIAITLTAIRYPDWYILAGLMGMSPDMAWIYRFTIQEKFGKLPPGPENKFNQWHTSIQKLEFKNGIFIEVFFAASLFYLLFGR